MTTNNETEKSYEVLCANCDSWCDPTGETGEPDFCSECKVPDETKSAWRPARYFRIASQVSAMFSNLLPGDIAETAIATCRITVQGPKAVGTEKSGKNWGEWVRTRMQTFGKKVNGYGTSEDLAVQSSGNWKSFDCNRILSDLLDCVGVTMVDFWDHYGHPAIGQKFVLDLPDILAELAGVEDETAAKTAAA